MFFFVRITYPGNHGNTPQLLGDLALDDPLEGLLHLDDVILVERNALLSERTNRVEAKYARTNVVPFKNVAVKFLYLNSFFT